MGNTCSSPSTYRRDSVSNCYGKYPYLVVGRPVAGRPRSDRHEMKAIFLVVLSFIFVFVFVYVLLGYLVSVHGNEERQHHLGRRKEARDGEDSQLRRRTLVMGRTGSVEFRHQLFEKKDSHTNA